MMSIRAGSGLGDSIYLQSIARHLIAHGQRVEVCSWWPDVFRPLGDNVKVSDFRRSQIDLSCHYTQRKEIKGTDIFEDMCIQAGLKDVDLKLDWEPGERRNSFRYILIARPREPLDRGDGFGIEMLPKREAYQAIINELWKSQILVQVGKSMPSKKLRKHRNDIIYELDNINLDLSDRTTIPELFDLAFYADALVGYCSFFVPLAESLNKPLLCLWSRAGTRSATKFIRTVTPDKILHKSTSRFVFDDENVVKATHEFLEQIGG